MALSEKLRVFLEENRAEYTHTVHPLAYTAREVASAERLPAREVAKTVVVFGDDGFHMMVLPANRVVDFQEVRVTLGLSHASMATEEELSRLFPDCELGAMPPMGNLYGMPVYLDSSLAGEPTIAFNGGTHGDEVHMRTADYRALVDPAVITLAREALARHGW
jgi:Ala-tRNA(Pro) deacylase